MNLRLVQFHLGPGKRSEAESIADEVVPMIRKLPGCGRCEFFADYETGDYGLVVFWESKQAAGAAASVMGPIVARAMAEAGSTSDTKRLFDIYEPKTS